MTATWVKCYTEWLKTGNIKLLEVLMKYDGFDEAELRKARESYERIRAIAISEDEADAFIADQ